MVVIDSRAAQRRSESQGYQSQDTIENLPTDRSSYLLNVNRVSKLSNRVSFRIFSGVHGSNYFDRTNNMLYVTLRGSDPIDIQTAPAVVIQFGFPAVSVDDFFGTNLVSNLAT